MAIAPKSLTHVHILNCVSTVFDSRSSSGHIRILDAGCGNGELIAYLHEALRERFPEVKIDIYGFDVVDHGVQAAGFIEKAMLLLHDLVPDVKWCDRIFTFSIGDRWQFESGFFDLIVSNQVLEHVNDKRGFFENVHRCLKDGGYSFHLAPLIHCMHEGHIWIPFAHRIKSYDLLLSYIKTCSRLGLGKFRRHHKETGVPLEEYTRKHADYMMFWTSYSSQSDILDMARLSGLRSDFRFTKEFYFLKLLQLLGIDRPVLYRKNQSAFLNAISILVLRYISSVTLTLQKGNEY